MKERAGPAGRGGLGIPGLLVALGIVAAVVFGGQTSVRALPLSSEGTWRALFGGPELPQATVALLTAPFALALSIVLGTRTVLHVPAVRLLGAFVLVLLAFVVSIAFSPFRFVSLAAAGQWLAYGLVFTAVCATAGKARPAALLSAALVLGGAILALRGQVEYFRMLSVDPTWRIFAGWVNPNALAGMLLICWFPAIALAASPRRSERLFGFVCAAFIGLALVLTQSRGAYLSAAVGLIGLLAASLAWSGWRRTLPLAGAIGLVGLFAGLQLLQLQRQDVERTALDRVVTAQREQEHSAAFRLHLYRTSLELMRSYPVGTGAGTFRFFSSRPGLVSPTHFAHNSYLQVGVEAGPIAAVLLVAFGLLVLVEFGKGARCLPPEANRLRLGALGALLAAGAHNLVDSDLYLFGSGAGLLVVIALGLAVSADGTVVEQVPRPYRIAFAGLTLLIAAGLVYVGTAEWLRARALGALAEGDRELALRFARRLVSLVPFDGDAAFLRGGLSEDRQEALRWMRRGAAAAPRLSNLRALARLQIELEDAAGAALTLTRALAWDPNNLPALAQLYRAYEQLGDDGKAREVAERLVAVEGSVSFKDRAVPELVPTETYEARLWLAERTQDREEALMLRLAALRGLAEYARRTYPLIVRAAEAGLDGSFGFERLDEARAKIALGKEVADRLLRELREPGQERLSEELRELRETFEAASESESERSRSR